MISSIYVHNPLVLVPSMLKVTSFVLTFDEYKQGRKSLTDVIFAY